MAESRNSKTLAGGGMASVSQNITENLLRGNNNKILSTIQPGTALSAFLKKYKFDLLLFPYNDHISRLVDCCDFILDEVEGGAP